MKYLAILVSNFLLLASIASAQVDGINIISENYTVSGSYGYEWWQGSGFSFDPGNFLYSADSGTFGGSSADGTPVSFSYAAPSPPGVFPATIFGQNWTSGLSESHNISTFAYHFNSTALGNGLPIASSSGTSYYLNSANSFIKSTAQASWQFQPIASNEQLVMNIAQGGGYFQDQNLVVTLSDLTDMNSLLNYNYTSGGIDYIANSYAFALNPNDQYQLSITSTSEIYDSDNLTQQFTASVEPAPEPFVSSIFSLALFIFIGSRKYFQST